MAISSRSKPYPVILEDAWQAHLAPKPEDAPTVISLFAGCGGSSLGYSMAGFRELLAVEWDNNAVESFRLNFPDIPVYHGDICKLSVEECLEMTGLQPGELDVLDGSPPCQGFSTAGKRNFDDGRNQLFREYVRLLEGLQPKVLIMENVSGMVKGKMKLIFADILQALKGAGYRVSARLMNAMYFDVPQSRARMIFVGVREDLGIDPSHPIPQAEPIPVKNVILGCAGTWSQRINPWVSATRPAATVCKTDVGYEVLNSTADLKAAALQDSWQMARVLQGKEPAKHFGLVRLNADKPSPTIQRDAGNTTTGMIHPRECRRLTIPEIRLIGSYPDGFEFVGTYKEQWARIGNSVPPLFMRAIAEHVRAHILTPERA